MPDANSTTGPRFRGVATLEGVQTSDKRMIGLNETAWRELPLSLMVMTVSTHGGNNNETVVAGNIDLMERRPTGDGTAEIYFEGNFDTGAAGVETARLVGAEMLRGVSIDFAADETVEILAEDEDGWPTDWLVTYTNVEIGAATVCSFPAFAGGYLELVDAAAAGDAAPAAATSDLIDLTASAALTGLPQPTVCLPCSQDALVAAGAPMAPPAAWFEDPGFDGPTPLTITDDGRIFGHLGLWNECHIGLSGRCIMIPHSARNYSDFRVTSCHTAEGTRIPTGTLFMGTGHAPTSRGLSVSAVQDHYANTGDATAQVAAGEDRWGPWIAGAMMPGLSDLQIRQARGSVLSGDWRQRGGQLELVAALHVNVGGFTVPHAELVASAAGEPMALVAAGAQANWALARRRRQVEAADVAAVVREEVRKGLAPLLAPIHQARLDAARASVKDLPSGPSAEQRIEAARAAVSALSQ